MCKTGYQQVTPELGGGVGSSGNIGMIVNYMPVTYLLTWTNTETDRKNRDVDLARNKD